MQDHATHAIYINCRNCHLALCFKHIRDEFPGLETIYSLLLGLWKAFHFSTSNRCILNEIQTVYGVKILNVIKATVTHWLSHDAPCKRTRGRYPIIIGSFDGIITKDPKAQLIGLGDQMFSSETLLQICFLEDLLSVTNVLSLVLQSDKKYCAAVHRAIQLTCLQLKQMRDNSQSSLLKSFNGCNTVLARFNEYNQQNVVGHSTRKW